MAEEPATILVVDDDPEVRAYMTAVLENAGFAVVQAADGGMALELVRGAQSIDLMLTDIRMPAIDGPELARRMARLRPGLRVLFVSGFAHEFAAGTLDANRLIIKPVRPRDLLRRVRSALAG